ncbi:hypothetical protein ACQJBY_069253 [Aegilops geniculata]
MQSLARTVCRAGTRGNPLKLMDCAAPRVEQSFAEPLRPCSWIRQIVSPIIPRDGVQAYGFCTRALAVRGFSTVGTAEVSVEDEDSSSPMVEHPPRIKFKRPDKTARHIMNILNKEAVDKVRTERTIPDVQPGCIVQMRVVLAKHQRNQDLRQEESQESKAVLPEGQNECTEEMRQHLLGSCHFVSDVDLCGFSCHSGCRSRSFMFTSSS